MPPKATAVRDPFLASPTLQEGIELHLRSCCEHPGVSLRHTHSHHMGACQHEQDVVAVQTLNLCGDIAQPNMHGGKSCSGAANCSLAIEKL